MAQGAMEGFELFKQGAEARLYRGQYLGRAAVAKHRFSKSYRHPELDKQLTRDRVKAEVRSLVRCQTLGVRTPCLYLSDLESATIIMEDLGPSAVTAREYIDARSVDDPALSALGAQVGKTLATVHAAGVIHGDLTTSNILVEDKGISAAISLDVANGPGLFPTSLASPSGFVV